MQCRVTPVALEGWGNCDPIGTLNGTAYLELTLTVTRSRVDSDILRNA